MIASTVNNSIRNDDVYNDYIFTQANLSSIDSDNSKTDLSMISDLISNKYFQEAEIKANEYINIHPDNITCLEYLVALYQKTANYSKAIYYQQLYIKAIQRKKTVDTEIINAMHIIQALKSQLTLDI